MSSAGDATFIDRTPIGTSGTTVAVKDLIDIAGLPSTAGCRAVERAAVPADGDALCLAGLRAATRAGEARLIGRTTLNELAMGATGINDRYGTPTNPLDPTLIPGGSSSGSGVAVAAGEAEVGIGTDTGGSVRIPAACCGVVGLKTTHGRIPTDGVMPLSQSLDSVGPIGRDVAAVVRGMRLLEPGFDPGERAHRIGRVRVPDVDPRIDAAIDRALAEAELEVVEVRLPSWRWAFEAALRIGLAEAMRNHGALLDRDPEGVTEDTAAAIRLGREQAAYEPAARGFQASWKSELAVALDRVELLAWPTLAAFPPTLEDADAIDGTGRVMEVNLAGLPALAQPVATDAPLPASLQLIGPAGGEERLVATGAVIEAAAGHDAG